MANEMSVSQVSAVLKEVIKQSTGITNVAALDTAQLLTIGQKALQVNADPVLGAISQVISRTIFSNRPYKRKFGSLQADPIRYGNMVRKITILDTPDDLKDNEYLPLNDGQSVDQYKVSKPKALQLNFVGQQTYEIVKTMFDTQLDTAFDSLEQFNSFISSVLVYVNNKINKIHEDTARATVSGYIAGKIKGDADSVVHLLTEYNALTGLNLTKQDVYKAENFGPFMKWVYSRMEEVSSLMTEYSVKFHTNLNDGNITRHTPKELQNVYLYAPVFYQTTSRVLADTYHDTFLKLPGAEMVNFWQSIDTPDTIKLKSVAYLDADGTIKNDGTAEFTQADVFGVIFDKEAMGYTPVLERTKSSPYNAAGEYRNLFWKFNERNWIDFTENGVVFLLD